MKRRSKNAYSRGMTGSLWRVQNARVRFIESLNILEVEFEVPIHVGWNPKYSLQDVTGLVYDGHTVCHVVRRDPFLIGIYLIFSLVLKPAFLQRGPFLETPIWIWTALVPKQYPLYFSIPFSCGKVHGNAAPARFKEIIWPALREEVFKAS